MKKGSESTNLFNQDHSEKQKLNNDKIKTTNVNILLNRVRLDQKTDLKKKIVFFSFLITIICIVGFLSLY